MENHLQLYSFSLDKEKKRGIWDCNQCNQSDYRDCEPALFCGLCFLEWHKQLIFIFLGFAWNILHCICGGASYDFAAGNHMVEAG